MNLSLAGKCLREARFVVETGLEGAIYRVPQHVSNRRQEDRRLPPFLKPEPATTIARVLAKKLPGNIAAPQFGVLDSILGRLLGNSLDFSMDPVGLLQRAVQEGSGVFTIGLGPMGLGPRIVVGLGTEFNDWFFRHTDQELQLHPIYQELLKYLSKEGVYFMVGGSVYEEQRAALRPLFQNKHMIRYVDGMVIEARGLLEKVRQSGELILPEDMGPVVMHIATQAFLGEQVRRSIGDDIFDVFRRFSGGVGFSPLSGLTFLPKYQDSIKAREELIEIVRSPVNDRLINRRDPSVDFLQGLVDRLCPSGTTEASQSVLELIVLVIWAGHETTTGQVSWVIGHLLQNRDYLKKVVQEIDDVVGLNEITINNLKNMPTLMKAILEAMRLSPVVPFVPRFSTEGISFGRYTIPRGVAVFASPQATHLLSNLYPEPHRFNPDRFDEGQGGKNVDLGFGGGKHLCLGKSFAINEMMVLIATLLKELDLRTEKSQRIRSAGGNGPNWPSTFKVIAKPRTNKPDFSSPPPSDQGRCPVPH